MARIPEYFSTENIAPSDRASNAWENAARRIPGFYNSVASNERERGQLLDVFFKGEASNARERGRLDAQAFKQLLWPIDILEYYDRRAVRAAAEAARAAEAAAAVKAPRGGSINLSGGGGGSRGRAAPTGYGPGETAESRANASIGGYGGGAQQIARGAGALGGMLSDGGYSAGRRGDEGGPPGDPYAYMRPAWKAQEERNALRDETVQGWTNEAADTADYWNRYYGRDQMGNGGGEYIPSGDNPTAQSRFQPAPTSPTWFNAAGSVIDDMGARAVGNAAGSAVSAVGNWLFGGAASTVPIPRE